MKKRLLAALLVVCLLCPALTGCGDDGTGKGFRFPIDAEPVSLDPQTATDTASITVLCALFEGLTRLDEEGKAVGAAADWYVSKDGLTYTFTIKEEATWWVLSGEENALWNQPAPVTADDFLFGIQRALDPANQTGVAAEMYGIKNAKAVHQGKTTLDYLGVQALDDKHLTITLEEPDSSFPEKLATSPFFPCNRSFFEHTAGRYGLEEPYVLGNGAFRLSAWNHDESLLLYKNEDYHSAQEILPEAVRFVIGTEDAAEALKTGDLDAALLSSQQAADLEEVTVMPLEDTVRSLYFNTTAAPLTTPFTRQALRDSIEWITLFQYLEGLTDTPEKPATGYVPPDATVAGEPYTQNAAGRYQTRLENARSNWKEGLGRIYPDGKGSAKLELLAADDPASTEIAQYVVQSWAKNLEIYPTLTLLPEAELEQRVKTGNYQAAILTVTPSGSSAGENLQSFQSQSPDNLSRFTDTGMDKKLTAALTGDAAALAALEEELWTLCPSIPLSYPTRYYGIAAGVEGVTVHPFGGGRYRAPMDFYAALKFDD